MGGQQFIDFTVCDYPLMEIQSFVDFDFVGMYLSRRCIEPFIPLSKYNIQFTKKKSLATNLIIS